LWFSWLAWSHGKHPCRSNRYDVYWCSDGSAGCLPWLHACHD